MATPDCPPGAIGAPRALHEGTRMVGRVLAAVPTRGVPVAHRQPSAATQRSRLHTLR